MANTACGPIIYLFTFWNDTWAPKLKNHCSTWNDWRKLKKKKKRGNAVFFFKSKNKLAFILAALTVLLHDACDNYIA